MTDSPVLYHQHDSIATVTLHRPETLNAMNEAMMAELERCLMALETDPAVRVVVLTGAGQAFSAGGDQKRDRQSEGQQHWFAGDLGGGVVERLHRCVLRLQRLAKPVIGSINGVAVGAGCNLALATDLRIAADTARFGEVFARIGLAPDGGGTYFLPRLVGTAKAMELLLLADIIDAREALRIGLVNWVVPADRLPAETVTLEAQALTQACSQTTDDLEDIIPCITRLFQNWSSERELALAFRMFEPTHVGCYGVLKEAPEERGF